MVNKATDVSKAACTVKLLMMSDPAAEYESGELLKQKLHACTIAAMMMSDPAAGYQVW